MEAIISNINLVYNWTYDSKNTKCTCNNPLYCVSDKNTIMLFECGHAFHSQCCENINECPYDNTELVNGRNLIAEGDTTVFKI